MREELDNFREARQRLERMSQDEQQFMRGLLVGEGHETLEEEVNNWNSHNWTELEMTVEKARAMWADLMIVRDYPYGGRDWLTTFAIDLSLCPIHFIDWAICFDDELEDCAQVRAIYPMSHDT